MGFDLLVFLLVLGLLIFFHEMGHFIAAKCCNIYVDRFSLGMPPRLFGIRVGETDYCIGALPLGGYVKMAGQEDAPLSEEERDATYGSVPPERWFNNRPLWQRFIVIFAGPAMNLVLAVLLYGIVAATGAQVSESEIDNRIGVITKDSPAAAAPMFAVAPGAPVDPARTPDAVGWQTGDRILSIEGRHITNIKDVAINAVLGAGETMRVELERLGPDGTPVRYASFVEPKVLHEGGHTLFGVSPFNTALLGDVLADSPAKAAGLEPGDIIVRADGKFVDSGSFVDLMEDLPEGQTVSLEVERNGQLRQVTMQPMKVGRFKDVMFAAAKTGDAKAAAPVVYSASEEMEKNKELLPGDTVIAADGQPVTAEQLRQLEKANPGRTFQLTVRRPAVLFGLVRTESTRDVTLTAGEACAIGVTFEAKMIYHRVPPAQVVPEAFRQGYKAVAVTMKTLAELLTGSVSPKELGGPLLIYQATSAAAREGYWYLLTFTAFISVNLCVFNLLPLPVLDGGLLLCLIIEGIRRKPLDIRILERIQQVGLVMIVALLLYVTYNDILRWVNLYL